MKRKFLGLVLFALGFPFAGHTEAASPLFEIKKIEVQAAPPPDELVWKMVMDPKTKITKRTQVRIHPPTLYESVPDPQKPGKTMRQFVPVVKVKVHSREKMDTSNAFAKVHIYDESKQLIDTLALPTAGTGAFPPFLEPNGCDLLFPLPKALLDKTWNALAVVGNQNEAASKLLRETISDSAYVFPERELTTWQGRSILGKRAVVDPVVVFPVKTGNQKQPILTLLMRPPKGITDYSQVEGVLCASVLANSPEQIHQMLLSKETETFGDKFAFADEHKLAIIAWGSRRLWTGKNYSDQTAEEIRQADHDFDEVADGWERGIKQLGEVYGIPMRNFLLWGYSGSGHWAARLALRKPGFFLAAHIHIPQHFDEPTMGANRILWLITAGEMDIGYQYTLGFFRDAKKLNYPIIHKGIEGMGHGRSPITDTLGTHFFEYALSLRPARDAYDKMQKFAFGGKLDTGGPWVEGFRTPPFYGDIVNQESFPAGKADMVPWAFRVSLPTKEIADAWNPLMKPASASAAEKRPQNAGANLALNKPFVCSNPHPLKPNSGGLTDGFWEGKDDQIFLTGDNPQFPKTATIDLENAAQVGHILLGIPVYSSTKTVVVSLSIDGNEFVDVGSFMFAKGNEDQHLFSFAPMLARYVRLTYPDHYGSYCTVATSEVEVYASEK